MKKTVFVLWQNKKIPKNINLNIEVTWYIATTDTKVEIANLSGNWNSKKGEWLANSVKMLAIQQHLKCFKLWIEWFKMNGLGMYPTFLCCVDVRLNCIRYPFCQFRFVGYWSATVQNSAIISVITIQTTFECCFIKWWPFLKG